MNKRKVLYSIYNSTRIGGPNNAMQRLSQSFLNDKYEFIPITIDEHLGKKLKISVLKRLIKEIKHEKPDIIYFTGMQLHGFYMALASFFAGYKKKSIMVIRGSSCDDLSLGTISKVIFGNFIEPVSLKLTGKVHTVCTEMALNSIVINNSSKFYGVIYNAAPKIDKIFPRFDFRDEISATDNQVILVYTGRLVKDKGIQFLLEAFSKIDGDLLLVLVGDGPDKAFFQNVCYDLNVHERVYFTGTRKDIIRILCGCDIFVFPTLHENLSNSLLEACSVGLPIVATNVGGNIEIVSDGINGILVNAADTEDLKNGISLLLNSKELRLSYGDMSKKIIHEKFMQEVIYGQIDTLFETISKD